MGAIAWTATPDMDFNAGGDSGQRTGDSPARSETGWFVRSFNVALAIQPDAGLDVTETIDADFEVPKHGIYREIPIRYAVGLHQYALRFQIAGRRRWRRPELWDEGDLRGKPDQDPRRRRQSNDQRPRTFSHSVSRPASTHLGAKSRMGRSRTGRGSRGTPLGGDRDRVGRTDPEGRRDGPAAPRPRRRARRLRRLDRGLWLQEQGLHQASDRRRTIAFETGTLQPGESITIDVTMPVDAVARAGWMREFSWWLVDNFPYGVFPATLAACFAGWFFRGCDIPGRGTVVVSYEPPEGLGPAEVGTLIDERVNLRDISAVIIDLAVRGYLKIAEVELEVLLVSVGLPLQPAQGASTTSSRSRRNSTPRSSMARRAS